MRRTEQWLRALQHFVGKAAARGKASGKGKEELVLKLHVPEELVFGLTSAFHIRAGRVFDRLKRACRRIAGRDLRA